MKSFFIILTIITLFSFQAFPQMTQMTSLDSICGHKTHWDREKRILPWYKPEIPGEGYVHVIKLASEFIKSGTPIDPKTGLKIYFISCCFQGPHIRSQADFDKGITWEDWMHNPACVWAGLVQGLVLDYRVFSGDVAYIQVVQEMLDYQLKNGTTPADWPWANVPYASSDPGATVYQGATRWELDGMRGDGLHGIEPDKVGELGIAYLKFYEVTEDKKYLEAAIHCATALAKHIRELPSDLEPFTTAEIVKSPWPFRVNARTGVIISEYCSNVIEPIRLFDELLRIQKRIDLSSEQIATFQRARNLAWKWLYSKSGPMKTSIWNAYFEDVPNDPERSNRNQVSPLETARYLIKHPELDPEIATNVPALIHWVASVFNTEGMDAIREQTWCYAPMASHTARYASLCALWYERTGAPWYKDQAYRFFNFATYMTYPNGVVAVGPNWPGSWFSDGYGDYIRHYMEGLAAIPEWAPADSDHLLRSSSVIQKIVYKPTEIQFSTYDENASVMLRLTNKPKQISVNDKKLMEMKNSEKNGWSWEPVKKGGILRIDYDGGKTLKIIK